MTKIDYHFIANFMENATLKYIGGLLFWPTLWLYEHTGHRTKRRHLSINTTTSAISFNSFTLLNEVESSGFRIHCIAAREVPPVDPSSW